MRILVCDDHTLLAEGLAVRLRGRGHDVRVEATPEGAVAAAAQDRPDLCLMDLRFPGRPLAGLEALPAVRAASPHTVLLLLSGAMTDVVETAAGEQGADGVSGKDIPLAALEAAVAQVARGRSLLPPDLAHLRGRSLLTPREREVLDLVRTGASTDDVARRLGIASSTVRSHLERVMGKLGVHSRAGALTAVGRDAASTAGAARHP